MATVGESAVPSGLVSRPTRFEQKGETTDRGAGPILLMGGTAYAAAYVVVGAMGSAAWGALLAIGGTALLLLGLKLVSFRSS